MDFGHLDGGARDISADFGELRLNSTAANSSLVTSSSSQSSYSGVNYIEHRVSRFDTLAGIAIKYGVEVRPSICILDVVCPFPGTCLLRT